MLRKSLVIATLTSMLFVPALGPAFAAKPDRNTPPTVTAFEVPDTSASPIPIDTFTASDSDGSVTAYLVTESANPPGASDPNWSVTPLTAYVTSNLGSVTLYAWAKDDQDAVSDPLSDVVNIPDPQDQLIAELQAAVSALQADITGLQAENSDQRSEIIALQGESALHQSQITGLQVENAALQADILNLQAGLAAVESNSVLQLDGLVYVDQTTINNLKGPHVIFEGANVHVRSGYGSTDEEFLVTGTLTGLGNFIVGYNELYNGWGTRSGSHNLVVGPFHSYSSYGGMVAGSRNTISGRQSSVVGGYLNAATEVYTSVTGGGFNTASMNLATVTGGSSNEAKGGYSSVGGGQANIAEGFHTYIGGGAGNLAGGNFCVISGGYNNYTLADRATVGGGSGRSATGDFDWVAGSLWEDQ